MSNVRGYTDKQLINRVRKLDSYQGIPNEYWILGVQSNEDAFNEFDDKFYLFHGTKFIMVTSGTTNAGLTGLLNYNSYTSEGVAVIKTDEWYYGLWKYGKHKGRMPALKQVRKIKYYRDGNKNRSVEEVGDLFLGMIGINFHTVTYNQDMSFFRKLIGGWSVGCQVANKVKDYYTILNKVKEQESVSYCLIKEF